VSLERVSCYILIDTNLFAERTRLLRTALGPSLLYFAKIRDAKIVVPEVVRSETIRYVVQAVQSLNERLAGLLRETREFLGQSANPSLPSVADSEKAVETRFAEISRWIQPITHTPELLVRAAKRVLVKSAPSHQPGKDSYKDSLIWECVLELPEGSIVHFASADNGFFDLEEGGGLHPTLLREASDRRFVINAHRGLESLVNALQGDEPEIDHARAAVVINHSLTARMVHAMQRWRVDETGQEVVSLQPYLTDRPGMLYIEFIVDCPVVGSATFGGTRFEDTKMRFRGNGYYDPHGVLTDLRISEEALYAANGSELEVSITEFAELSIGIGEPREKFRLRRPLQTQPDADADTRAGGRSKMRHRGRKG